MTVDLPVPYVELMLNSWEILGNFMYPRDAFARLFDLVRAGHLSLAAVEAKTYPLAQLPQAMGAAAKAGSFECIVMQHNVLRWESVQAGKDGASRLMAELADARVHALIKQDTVSWNVVPVVREA